MVDRKKLEDIMVGKVKVPVQGENKAQYYERWLYRCRSRKGQCKTYEEQTTGYFFFLLENDPEILFSNFKALKNPLRNSLSFGFQSLTP